MSVSYKATSYQLPAQRFGANEFDLRRRVLTDTARSQPQSKGIDFQSRVSYNIPSKLNLTGSPYAAQVSVEATLAPSPASSGPSSASAIKRLLQKQEWKYPEWKLYLREVS